MSVGVTDPEAVTQLRGYQSLDSSGWTEVRGECYCALPIEVVAALVAERDEQEKRAEVAEWGRDWQYDKAVKWHDRARKAEDRAEQAVAERDRWEHRAEIAEIALEDTKVERDRYRDALEQIDTNAQLPDRIDPDSREAAEWWKHVASKRREIARAALAVSTP